MFAVISLLIILTVSILITRVATVALGHTGLSRESARFQARSAFTGVGFTTTEAEKVVNHPLRRRILMVLMLLGNAGIVTAISSMILTFVDDEDRPTSLIMRAGLLIGGIALLWTAAYSKWLDRHLSRLIRWALDRYSDLDVRDYASLLHLGGEYAVMELQVQPDDWLADRTLSELGLRDEGVLVLGIQPEDGGYVGAPTRNTRLVSGDTVVLYGRDKKLAALDQRSRKMSGELAHQDAVAEQRQIERETDAAQEAREVERQPGERVDEDTGGA